MPEDGPAGAPVRILCLGNELIADDAIGYAAAAELRRRLPGTEVVEEFTSGFYLMDSVLGAERLVVVDAVVTGAGPPGTIHVFGEQDLAVPGGSSPHYVGLFETLDLARALGLDAPSEVILVCVEVSDVTTIGGPMTPPVRAALPDLVELVASLAGAGAPA
jgi:hydrogenase maturation protease